MKKHVTAILGLIAAALCLGLYIGSTETEKCHQSQRIASLEADKSATLALVGIVDNAKAAAVATCSAAGGKDCDEQISIVVSPNL